MKAHKLALAISASYLLAACSTTSTDGGPTFRAGDHYNATGSISGVKAHLYGERTLLEYEHLPMFISIKDNDGKSVNFEKEGNFVRLDRKVRDFTVRSNLIRTTRFYQVQPKLAPTPQVKAAVTHAAPAEQPALDPLPIPAVQNKPQAKIQEDAELVLLLESAQQQLNAVRGSAEQGATDLASLERLNERLDQIQSKIHQASSSVLMVYFDRYKTDFKPTREVADLIFSVASAAELVKVRGRTDSVIPGTMDGKIALARAESARSYLLKAGVSPQKIEVSALAAGDFIAPNTAEGKGLNRRVELEFFSKRVDKLSSVSKAGYANAEQVQ